MSQVIISMGNATSPRSGQAQVYPPNMRTEEIASTASAQSGTVSAEYGDICTVHNIGAEIVWVKFNGTASVTNDHVIPANTHRDFGPLESGMVVSVINDS